VDEATARLRLERMVAWDQTPALTVEEMDRLLDLARRADEEGREPGDADWVPTWALGPAAAEGWTWKAARVAGHYDFNADGSSLSKSQVMAHCLRMAEVFGGAGSGAAASASGAGTFELGHPVLYPDVVGNLNL